jgi:hypothetical protein
MSLIDNAQGVQVGSINNNHFAKEPSIIISIKNFPNA